MLRPSQSFAAVGVLVAVALTFGVQRGARADDTGALIGGLIAGAIVYELLDDDDGYCRAYRHGYYYPRRYYGPPVYYRSYPRYYAPPYGVTVWYEEHYPSWGARRYRDYDPPHRYGDRWRAPSHAKRGVGPPPLYGKSGKHAGGGKYSPPRRYYK